ncbi:MAG: FecR domain-containing protein [Brevundimonas sp.]|uniref:FecR family protein n=1 Tax=Brevundimonas sp. TaxID=1871086 RepID=UPI00258299A8|nr:FecR domain-containing protein [Brevundimonas sp.]MCV0413783.1 FecR domain-containing protein [Brevundimonas sp.]
MTVATPRDIDDEAVAWAVRIDADGFGADEATALEAWLARDSRHGGALLRAEAAMALLDREDLRPVAPPPHREPRRWAWRGMAVGAGLSAIAAAAAVVLVLAPRAGDYRTDVGEQRRVMLDDGSVALVNTDSRIRVRFAEGERRIRLDEGEAWFQVAKNADRPFIVDVDDVHVRATGTAFSVRRRGEATEVVVTEGAVVAWRDGEDADRATISVGQGARIEPRASKVRVDVVDDRSALAWREGKLVLDGMTVGEAAAELNRYNARKIVIADPAVRTHRMVGLFLINKPEEFIDAVKVITGSEVSVDGQNTVIG